jgi:hypothetical protein
LFCSTFFFFYGPPKVPRFAQSRCKRLLLFFCSDRYTDVYGHFPERLRLQLLNETRAMFNFGYDSYMKFAFPLDELDPIHCTGKIIKIYSGGRS